MPQIKLSEKCSRCPREESIDLTLDEAIERVKSPPVKVAKALVITIDGETSISYDYLCEECRGIVTTYCAGAKQQEKRSARRFKRVKVPAEERRKHRAS